MSRIYFLSHYYARVFFKDNVRYPIWICRDPISLILGTRFLSDSKDPIFNYRKPNRVPKTP